MKHAVRLALSVLAAALAIFFLLPLLGGICHIGMLYPAALLGLFSAVLAFPGWFGRLFHGRSRPWAIAASSLLAVGLIGILSVLIAMGIAADHRPTEECAPDTVIVLGCQVISGRPSIMLRDRIDAACDYLLTHPDTVCVASGGMDDNEDITEAQCIFNELVRRGIAPERIYREERSSSTAENLAFSAAVIADNGLSAHVAIASDNFHQLRAALFARRNGLEPCSLGCRTLWFLSPGYWAREVVGVAAAFVRGY